MRKNPIGIFDSGVGGLSVLRAIREQHPAEDLIYIADQAHVPYGTRTLKEVCQFSETISAYLLDQGAKLIVVACNTASAAALHHLRQIFPKIPFVGMEPAIKPAAETTETGVVGVLATPATFRGEMYASSVEKFASGVMLLENTCTGLVEQIEAGNIEGSQTAIILENALKPMLAANIDTVVLGCTHYPFVIPQIKKITGDKVRLIDPAPAIASQVGNLLDQFNLHTRDAAPGEVTLMTSGDVDGIKQFVSALNILEYEPRIEKLIWDNGNIGLQHRS